MRGRQARGRQAGPTVEGSFSAFFGTKYRIYKEMFSYRLINILNVEDLQDYP